MTTNSKLVTLALAFAASGCGDPLVERQTITDLRVLGARYEADADPNRATPLPGEAGTVRWLVANTGGPTEVSFGLSACAATESARGVPQCAAPAVEEVLGASTEPTLELEVPDGARLLTTGVFCSAGDVALTDDPRTSHCVEPSATQELASYEVTLAGPTNEPHGHPDLQGATLRLDGDSWTEEDTPCVPRGARVPVDLTLLPEARDARPPEDPAGSWETLQVSHLSTHGKFERPFTVFGGDTNDLHATVEWQAPNGAATAHVYFVVRDLRGGVSWLLRRVCVE